MEFTADIKWVAVELKPIDTKHASRVVYKFL